MQRIIPDHIREEGIVKADITDFVEPFSQQFGSGRAYIESGVEHHKRQGLIPGGEEGKVIRKRLEEEQVTNESHVIK